MIQPEGTVTYKGRRKSRPGEQSFGPDKVVKKAAEDYEAGKRIERGDKPEAKKEYKNSFDGE